MIKLTRTTWSTHTSGNITVKLTGYLMFNDRPLLNATSFFKCFILGEELDDVLIRNIFSKDNVSGNFACIIETRSKYFLVTDIIRSQPIHIIKNRNGFDVVDFIDPQDPQPLDDQIVNIFLNLGFSHGATNCFANVYSLQAAEIVTMQDGNIDSYPYFKYIPTNSSNGKELSSLIQDFDSQLKNTINNMLDSAPLANNWIVPLSGGHDSRLIVNYLHKAGVKKAICFSYGIPNNLQSQLSQKIAREAGYPWYFVEYTEEKWANLNKSGLVDEFIDYAFQGISTPHLQDFLAVFELKEKGIIREGDIFVPGHSGITGIGYTEETEELKDPKDGILVCYNKSSKKNVPNIESVPKFFKDIFIHSPLQPTEFYAYWNWKGRQTKFIANSIRVYEFFGFEARLPFWEKQFVEFWLSMSPAHITKRKFLFIAEKSLLSKNLAAIPFEDELKQKPKENRLKKKLKKVIPNFLTIALLRLTNKKQKIAEGVNKVYAQKGKSLKEIIHPLDDFPQESLDLIKPLFGRYLYQINFHFATRLLTIRRAYNHQKKEQ